MSIRQLKERAHALGESLQGAECGVEASFQVEFVFDGLPADAPVFDFVPNLFVGIEFGGVGREKDQTNPGAMGTDELAHHRRAVERGAIHHEDQRARAVISTLLSSLNDLNRSSRDLQETGVLVRDEVERVLMNFQMQDRLSQILTCVMEDMARMGEHLQQGGDLSMTKAGEWLAQLDASYTMEEQRSQHHGNTTIQRETGIEFF